MTRQGTSRILTPGTVDGSVSRTDVVDNGNSENRSMNSEGLKSKE